jgi:hypothetical protein
MMNDVAIMPIFALIMEHGARKTHDSCRKENGFLVMSRKFYKRAIHARMISW